MPSRNAPSARKDTVTASVQADEPCRLVRVGKPSWEVLIDRLEYNMPAWNASNWIVKHNLKIIRHVQHIQDYETGKRSDPPPFSFAELLNPRLNAREPSVKRNTGLDRLDYLFASLKRYEPGHAPAQNYENVFITTRALLLLLKKCADVYGRRPEEQQLSRSLECVYAFQRFVEDTATLHLTRQEYDAKLDAMHERIAASFTENALLFETLCERRERAKDGIGGCGGFTQADRTMLRQVQRAAVFGEIPTDAQVAGDVRRRQVTYGANLYRPSSRHVKGVSFADAAQKAILAQQFKGVAGAYTMSEKHSLARAIQRACKKKSSCDKP